MDNKIGICLGGGGALGFAHIGALRALEERCIFPYRISGASMGAIIGVMYAQGYSPERITEIIEEHKLYAINNIINPFEMGLKAGLSGHSHIEKLLQKYVGHDRFESLARPFAVSVVDIRTAEWKVVSSGGNLIRYVLASMSIPLAFEPEEIDGGLYVDGGMMNNMPVEPLLPTCRKIIGVDVQTAHPYEGKVTRTNMLPIAYRLIQKQMNRDRVGRCDFYLTFPDLDEYGASDFSKYKEITEIGYRETRRYLDRTPEILALAKVKTVKRK